MSLPRPAAIAGDEEIGPLRLWAWLLAPPLIWAARFATSYGLVPYACWWGWLPVMHAVTLVALVACGAVGMTAWRAWRSVGGGREVEAGAAATRTRFMAIIGMFSAALFSLVILAEGLANVFVHACQTAGAPLA